MFIDYGMVYVNFTGSERVRVVGFSKPAKDVYVADLMLPGGKRLIARDTFEGDFALEVQAGCVLAARVTEVSDVLQFETTKNRKQRRAEKRAAASNGGYADSGVQAYGETKKARQC